MEDPIDRRKSQRAMHGSKIAFSIEGRENQAAISRDISSGGICIETETSLEPGTPLVFFLNLDQNQTGITVHGEVLRSWNDNGRLYSAVQFRNMSSIHSLALKAFIEELLKNPET